MYTIENDSLKVAINPLGAELTSLFNKGNGYEYMWNGDAKFWAKKSPVLFPIVGTLKNNSYSINAKSYELSRHGFAREKVFTISNQTATSISFELQNDEQTLSVYPFQFSFSLIYTIEKNNLTVTYVVKNIGNDEMLFSVGAHPAFKLPIADELAYEDYYLLFNKTENAGRWPISAVGLIESAPTALLENTNRLPLTKSLFYKDAIVLKNLASDSLELKSDKHPIGFTFTFKGFPYLGIWAAKDADFICIEPWCGIADSVNSNQVFGDKEGIVKLGAGEMFERSWGVMV